MFDTDFRNSADGELIAAIADLAVAEAASAGRRLSAIAELVRRRCDGDERAHWCCDEWDAAAAELSAVLAISHGRASGQMHVAMALSRRLPRVATLLLAGAISPQVVTAIVWRTGLVIDDEAMALIDHALADNAARWGSLSQYKLDQAIDAWIDRYDPGALRRTRDSARNRDVTIGAQNHESGTASLWGRLFATDAALLERRLNQMAREVCDDDPRTMGQRRADAVGALAAGAQRLSCQCGNPQCPSAGPDARAGSVIIHVLADPDALEAQPDPAMSGEADLTAPEDQPGDSPPGSAVIVGGGALPTPLLAALLRDGAKVRYLRKPAECAEPQYRPSTALDEFVRLRDMTCRFPNCDQPAEACDVDHGVPWPDGPTHASGLRLLCRRHHIVKTFWRGPGGWHDEQAPDGTIVWTSPTGATYTTRPGSALLFPRWDTRTAALPASTWQPGEVPDAAVPTRTRTRAAERASRIRRERALNDAHVAERNKPPPFDNPADF